MVVAVAALNDLRIQLSLNSHSSGRTDNKNCKISLLFKYTKTIFRTFIILSQGVSVILNF